jgi:hypothetical protein
VFFFSRSFFTSFTKKEITMVRMYPQVIAIMSIPEVLRHPSLRGDGTTVAPLEEAGDLQDQRKDSSADQAEEQFDLPSRS